MNLLLGQINPIAIQIGPIQVAWYGIIIVAGMFLAIWLSSREAEKRLLGEDFILDLAFWVIPIAIIGARLYYVLFEFDQYIQDPLSIFYIWEGGLAIYGGVIAGLLVVMWYSNRHKVNIWLVLDILAPHVLIAQSIGRWGNFINQEAYGPEVARSFLENLHLPEFIIEGMNIGGTYHHPTFLYESVWSLIGFILIMLVRNKSKFLLRGEAVSLYMIWYGVGRFFIEGMRTDSLYIGPLKVNQLVSLVLIFIGVGIIIYKRFFQYPKPPYYTEGMKPEIDFEKKKEAHSNN